MIDIWNDDDGVWFEVASRTQSALVGPFMNEADARIMKYNIERVIEAAFDEGRGS